MGRLSRRAIPKADRMRRGRPPTAVTLTIEMNPLARKIRGVFRFRYRHKSPHVVQVQC